MYSGVPNTCLSLYPSYRLVARDMGPEVGELDLLDLLDFTLHQYTKCLLGPPLLISVELEAYDLGGNRREGVPFKGIA